MVMIKKFTGTKAMKDDQVKVEIKSPIIENADKKKGRRKRRNSKGQLENAAKSPEIKPEIQSPKSENVVSTENVGTPGKKRRRSKNKSQSEDTKTDVVIKPNVNDSEVKPEATTPDGVKPMKKRRRGKKNKSKTNGEVTPDTPVTPKLDGETPVKQGKKRRRNKNKQQNKTEDVANVAEAKDDTPKSKQGKKRKSNGTDDVQKKLKLDESAAVKENGNDDENVPKIIRLQPGNKQNKKKKGNKAGGEFIVEDEPQKIDNNQQGKKRKQNNKEKNKKKAKLDDSNDDVNEDVVEPPKINQNKQNNKFKEENNVELEEEDPDSSTEEVESELTEPKPSKGNKASALPKSKRFVLFVGNIAYDTTKEELHEHFKKVGNIKDVRIPSASDSKKPRGFAYLEVGDEESYQRALSMHHSFLKKRRINVLYSAGGNKKSPDQKNLLKSKNQKLHAMRKQGQLAGSTKDSNKRSVRRAKKRQFDKKESE